MACSSTCSMARALLLLSLVASLLCATTALASQTAASSDSAALDFGTRAINISDVSLFTRVSSSTITPMVMLLLPPLDRSSDQDDDSVAAAATVAARVRRLADMLAEMSVLLAYTSSESPVAAHVRQSLSASHHDPVTALLYQGIHEMAAVATHADAPNEKGDETARHAATRRPHKTPSLYSARWYSSRNRNSRSATPAAGEEEADGADRTDAVHDAQPYTQLVRWIAGALSPACLHRLESEADVHAWLTAHKRYPDLPRVLYVTATPYVSPVLRVLSQLLCGDAVFGVVVDAFAASSHNNGSSSSSSSNGDVDAAARHAIARHYGVASAAEAPALMVLHPRTPQQHAQQPHRRNVRDGGSSTAEADVQSTTGARTRLVYAEDEVHRMPECDANATFNTLLGFLDSELPRNYLRVLRQNDTEMLREAHMRRHNVLHQLAQWHRSGNASGDADDDDSDGDDGAGDDTAGSGTRVQFASTQQAWQQLCPLFTNASEPARHCLVVFAEGDGVSATQDGVQYAMRVLRDVVARVAQQSPSLARGRQLQPVVLPAARSGALMRWFGVGENGLPDAVLLLRIPASSSSSTPSYVSVRYVGAFTADRMAEFYTSKARLLAGRGADAVVALGARRLSPQTSSPPPPLSQLDTTVGAEGGAARNEHDRQEKEPSRDDGRGDL